MKQKCPKCGSNKTIPILYGYPSKQMHKAAERGFIGLGGCIVDDSNPEFRCKECRHEFKKETK
jgi:Zn finger protein HypA/HybF involved in hydrogenase expression